MRKITKSILLEILPLFFICNFFFIFLMLLEQVVQLAELIFVHGMPLLIVIKITVCYIPSFIVLTAPISTILSVLLAFSRFSSDSELVAMQACGAGKKEFLRPVLIFGVLVAASILYINIVLLPKGSALALNTVNEVLQNLSINNIREREMYNELEGFTFYADKKVNNANFEKIIMIYKDQSAIITAQKGVIVPNKSRSIMMRFDSGRLVVYGESEKYTVVDFDGMTLNMPLNINVDMLPHNEKLMTLGELRENFNNGNIYLFEYVKRLSFPFSAIVMSLFGMIFGSFLQRSGKSVGVVTCCIIALAYNVLYIIESNYVNDYNPVILGLLPTALLTIGLIPLLRRFKV